MRVGASRPRQTSQGDDKEKNAGNEGSNSDDNAKCGWQRRVRLETIIKQVKPMMIRDRSECRVKY